MNIQRKMLRKDFLFEVIFFCVVLIAENSSIPTESWNIDIIKDSVGKLQSSSPATKPSQDDGIKTPQRP